MVYYYESQVTDPYTTLYMGKDKFESEFSLIMGVLEADPRNDRCRMTLS